MSCFKKTQSESRQRRGLELWDPLPYSIKEGVRVEYWSYHIVRASAPSPTTCSDSEEQRWTTSQRKSNRINFCKRIEEILGLARLNYYHQICEKTSPASMSRKKNSSQDKHRDGEATIVLALILTRTSA